MRQLVFLFVLALPLSVGAQDLQNRNVIHTAVDLSRTLYLANWSVTNVKTQSPNNTNLFTGIGYRQVNWWLESMLWKQWNSRGGLWGIDNRFRAQLTKNLSVYAEPAVILTNPAFYEFIYAEYAVSKKLRVGGETENTHRLTKQSIAVGPRVGYVLGRRSKIDFQISMAYRLSPTGKDELRLYFNVTRRFSPRF